MELELGLAPPNANARRLVVDHLDEVSSSTAVPWCGKRGFREAFQETATTLPLFDDGSSDIKRKKQLIGWPPVSSARRACGANYVKVKKEGDAIGRKVDLALHASYDDLLATLARMFPTNDQEDKEMANGDHHRRQAASPVVTYEDSDGDLMLVGDVPWDDFIRSVKRLKILG
ncbi:hypothetical protein ABZP36_023140 [Zizania latifolia]